MLDAGHPDSSALEGPHGLEKIGYTFFQRKGHRGFVGSTAGSWWRRACLWAQAQTQLEEAVIVTGPVLEVAFQDLEPELCGRDLAPDDGGLGDPVLGHELGGFGSVGNLLDFHAQSSESLRTVG